MSEPAAHDPAAVGQGPDEVGAEVCALQASCLGSRGVEGGLELGVKHFEEAVLGVPLTGLY
jgi:hypothetical protein